MDIIQNIKTFLPIFNGFYNSIWQFDDDYVMSNINDTRQGKNLKNIEMDNMDINYRQYETDISMELCDIVQRKLSDYIHNIEYENVYSPKEYNFSSDVINCIITPNIDNIKKFIYEHKKEYAEYLENKYTSYDGFMSSYSNKFDVWEADTEKFNNLGINSHCLGSILEFISDILSINELNLYYDIITNMDLMEYINNIEQCFDSVACDKCQKFIEDTNILKDIKKYHKLMNKYPANIICSECN